MSNNTPSDSLDSNSTPTRRLRISNENDDEDGTSETRDRSNDDIMSNDNNNTNQEDASDMDNGTQEGDSNDNGDDENDDSSSEIERRRNRGRLRRQQRLLSEVRDLQQQQQTYFPGDADYNGIETTPLDVSQNNSDDDDDNDEDFQEEEGVGVNYSDTVNTAFEEDEIDGEDLIENADKDYQRIAALDTYATEGLDDREYEGIGASERMAAEGEIAEREEEDARRRGDTGGRSGRFYDALFDAEEEDEEKRRMRRGRMRRGVEELEDEEDRVDMTPEEEEEEDYEQLMETEEEVNLEAFDLPLREWIAQDRTRREVQRKFRNFLNSFSEDDDEDEDDNHNDDNAETLGGGAKRKRKFKQKKQKMYLEKIRNMCSLNLSTLDLSYIHLMQKEPTLAIWIVDAPRDMFDVLNEAATRLVLRIFPSYGSIHDEIHVRISDLPIMDYLRSLRKTHLDRLVRVNGVVTRRSGVYPQLKLAYYDCLQCKGIMGPFRVDESAASSNSNSSSSAGGGDAVSLYQPNTCSHCEANGPFRLNTTRTEYRNYQRVNLQETPGSVPPGRVPRTKEIILTNDLIDIARPGEEVEITGIYSHGYDYSLTQSSGFPVFTTFIFANHVRRKEDASSFGNLTEADRAQILELSRDPKLSQRILDSIAPSIYGHEHVKMALAMSLFGAVPKNISDGGSRRQHEGGVRIRGDINVLLLGDPGTAKSQMLKYAEATAPRAVYSTGKGASAVGLTASVHKDPLTKEWTLEGGALVLADRGVCLIDEFDKMNEQDRTSIHEAMEQQSISISKAGIVTSLQARCSVIAAANPIGGRYDSSCAFAENVELTDPILQRFDLLCVLQDTVDPVADERLAKFVTGSHMRSVATNEYARGLVAMPEEKNSADEGAGRDSTGKKLISQTLLRKYIQYARTNVKPILRENSFDMKKVESLYVELRRESKSLGGVPIAVRHVESMMRLAEAHAKMHLREYVREDDMDASVGMMLQSFITAQKFSVRRQLKRGFAKYISSGEDRAYLLLHILQDMIRNEAMYQTIRLRQTGQDTDFGILEVSMEEFEGKARDRRIYDVNDFCHGDAFRDAGYLLDKGRGVISREQITTAA